jgi:hypothetical protein
VEGVSDSTLFVSHVHEDHDVAGWLRNQLRDDFLGRIEVFVSSEREGHAGEDWLKTIDEALHRCRVLIALCSPISIHRPWVNFELGAAWMLQKRIIPVCHAGLTPDDLKAPLSTLHGITLTDAGGIKTLYETLAEQFGFPVVPVKDFAELAAAVPAVGAAAGTGGDNGSIEVQMVTRDRDIRLRLRRALETGLKWRTIGRVAVEAAVPEGDALDILRADDQVRFSRGKHGDLIVGLIDRVGTPG